MKELKTCCYEWCIEEYDEFNDIVDNDFNENLSLLDLSVLDDSHKLCLVRDDYNVGATKGWAYVKNNRLPNEFDNGTHVPKRFTAELAVNT